MGIYVVSIGCFFFVGVVAAAVFYARLQFRFMRLCLLVCFIGRWCFGWQVLLASFVVLVSSMVLMLACLSLRVAELLFELCVLRGDVT